MTTAKRPTKKRQTIQVSAVSVVTRRGIAHFRRAGRSFGPQPVEIALADLSDSELQSLRNEPRLTVTEISD